MYGAKATKNVLLATSPSESRSSVKLEQRSPTTPPNSTVDIAFPPLITKELMQKYATNRHRFASTATAAMLKEIVCIASATYETNAITSNKFALSVREFKKNITKSLRAPVGIMKHEKDRRRAMV